MVWPHDRDRSEGRPRSNRCHVAWRSITPLCSQGTKRLLADSISHSNQTLAELDAYDRAQLVMLAYEIEP